MQKRYYLAYGSNLNLRQMHYRCPGARLVGTGRLENYELQFKGQPQGAFATVTPKAGSSVPVAVWDISAENERALDRYEGYPVHYFKENVSVRIAGRQLRAMVYRMNLKMDFGLPSPYYYDTVQEGYLDCGLDTDFLQQALRNSAEQFYEAHQLQLPQEEAEVPEWDDDDPEVTFSEGMQL